MKADRRTARRQLDQRFARLRSETGAATMPHRGWVRAIREALGMSQRELAARMGQAHSLVDRLERSEPSGKIQLDTLRRAADAMECDVVYALLPRKPLMDLVQDRARRKARAQLSGVAHTMRLEDQATTDDAFETLVEDRATELIDQQSLWSGDPIES